LSTHQGQNETVRDFADRMRNLARQVTPQTDNPEAQKLCNQQTERMMVASFTNGIRGNQGTQIRFAMTSVMDDAVRIAVTVEQAESSKGKSETFYVDSNTEEKDRKKTSRRSANKTSRSDIRCFECVGKGHYANLCPTRKLRLESNRKTEPKSAKVSEAPSRKESGRGKWRGNRQPRKPSENF
jgi:septal ring-binding cell division protein DamX